MSRISMRYPEESAPEWYDRAERAVDHDRTYQERKDQDLLEKPTKTSEEPSKQPGAGV